MTAPARPAPLLVQVLEPANAHIYRDMTLAEYLKANRYSAAFTNAYVVPMCAAVWSVPNAQVRPVERAATGVQQRGMAASRSRGRGICDVGWVRHV